MNAANIRRGGFALSLLALSVSATASTPENGHLVSQAPLAAANGLSEAAAQYRINYLSEDGVTGNGTRTDSAAVFLPRGTTPDGGWPVVVWTHGTVGTARDCAPSLNPRTPRDTQYLNTWLSLGFAIVAPDYPGLGSGGLHHYLNARAEAWSTLDSVRAALATFPLKNQLILVGQSQGAHAAFATAGYQPEYARELNITATVLTGPPYFNNPDAMQRLFSPQEQSKHASGDPKLPYVFYIYQSAADQDKKLQASDYFTGQALPLLAEAQNLCITPLTNAVMAQKLAMDQAIKPAIQDVLTASVSSIRYPTLKITHPVFIGIGGQDINVPTTMQQQFARDVSAAGTPVDIHFYPDLDHSGTVNPSLRDSVPFVLHTMNAGK